MKDLLELRVDGEPTSASWPLDRGLQYGDGLFETMVLRNGRIRFETLHRERLAEGCLRLAIAADLPRIWEQLHAALTGRRDALLKLQVTRGDASARGYTPSGKERARAIVSIFAAPQATELPSALRVVSSTHRLGENRDLAGLKHCNRLEQVLARQALAGSGAFEGLMASSSGLLISGTMSNVFIELDGDIVTPVLDRCGVAGIMRRVVLREAEREGFQVRVAELPFTALAQVTALALSNARIGLLAADELDGRRLGRSARLAELAARMAELED